MPNAYGKTIDKTYLSIDKSEIRGIIHRDMIAHCFRWSHIAKFLHEKNRYKTANIMDVGCGRETPLLKTLYSNRLIPETYVGIDVGPINQPDKSLVSRFQVTLHPHTNILNVEDNGYRPNIIVMFECLEHVETDMGVDILKHIQAFMNKGTTFFLSTPCYDGVNKAGNHVAEWTYNDLRETLLTLSYKIVNVYGTFASIKDYKHLLTEQQLELFEELRNYYDTNLLACIFAPLFPANSRNALWKLTI